MGHWTDKGFESYNLAWYLDEINGVFKDAFGDDFIIDPDTPQGVLIQRLAELFYNADMDGIQALSLLNLNSASGIWLDIIGSLRGIPRSLGEQQTAEVTLTCNPTNFIGFTIPSGVTFTDAGNTYNFVTTKVESVQSTQASIQLKSVEPGNTTAAVGDKLQVTGFPQITDIVITNLINGSGREDDISYRRRLQTQYPAANNTIQYVEEQISKVAGIRAIGHNYNDTAEQVGLLPAYTTEWMAAPEASVSADPGALERFKTDVAKAIVDNKVPGSPTYGNTSVTVSDIFDTQKTVNFTIPTMVNLQIRVKISVPETTGFLDLSNVENIKSTIMNYINHLPIGKEVAFSRCIAPLAADQGFDVDLYEICNKEKQDWVQNSSYSIGEREYANIALTDIQIGDLKEQGESA